MEVKHPLIAALVFLFLPVVSIAEDNDSSLIDVVRNLNVATLEEGLPDIAVPLWLEQAFEHGKQVEWEVNDCGEGGDGRTAPFCVEAIIPQQKGYRLHISVIVADRARQKISKPQILMIYFNKREGYKTLDVIRVKIISEAIRLFKTDLGAKAE